MRQTLPAPGDDGSITWTLNRVPWGKKSGADAHRRSKMLVPLGPAPTIAMSDFVVYFIMKEMKYKKTEEADKGAAGLWQVVSACVADSVTRSCREMTDLWILPRRMWFLIKIRSYCELSMGILSLDMEKEKQRKRRFGPLIHGTYLYFRLPMWLQENTIKCWLLDCTVM